MAEHVTVEYGHHVWIDAQAWVGQRVGEEHTELTSALRDWGRRGIVTWAYQDWITRVELWCQARDYRICEGFPLMHEERLSRDVFVLLAVAGDCGPVAIVWIDEDPPTVYADLTTDTGEIGRASCRERV